MGSRLMEPSTRILALHFALCVQRNIIICPGTGKYVFFFLFAVVNRYPDGEWKENPLPDFASFWEAFRILWNPFS